MKPMQKMKGLKRALALAAVLAMTGAAWAKNGGGPGIPGDLSPDRTSVTLSLSFPACTTGTQSGEVFVYIFQPSGRLLSIGIGDAAVTCNGAIQDVPVTVEAVEGLTFKPGPATLLYRFTTLDVATSATISIAEAGSRVDLH